MSSVERYRERAVAHSVSRDAGQRTSAILSRWRLATFLPALGLLVWSGSGGGPVVLLPAAALFLLFGALVVRHARVDERVAWFDALRAVNERSIARIERRWDGLPAGNVPAGVATEGHPYAVDLDLFGRASLFQLLGPAATAHGAVTLAQWLLGPAPADQVQLRQDAVADLAPRHEWREHLAAFGTIAEKERVVPIEAFLSWVESRAPALPLFRPMQILVYAITGSIWVLIALHATGVTPVALWPIPLVVGMILSFGSAHPLTRAFDAAGAGQNALKRYAGLLAHLLSAPFTAVTLAGLQQRLRSDTEPAPAAMGRLNRILGFAELRSGSALLHFPIQAVTLWDFHVLFALDRWRRSMGTHVRDWLEATGELDSLSCLAGLHADNPAWCWPRVAAGGAVQARALGHPLIANDRRVANDVTVGPSGTVLLVTGSNMSGKSTLLRAIGLNTVLAQAGAPACAGELSLPACDLQTSIRIQDSLERGISYFMAALTRLKGVVDAAERGTSDRVLLYLLDEILQGTNSAERAIAVQAVARHLLDAGAIGVMTTHDLSLADEEPLRSTAVLVHFTETVDDDGSMRFDYTLRPGIATSRNALRLMRFIGIQ
ncbi:MAG: DNA mismatch repair protein MutS [Vicinamibacterales bacterium]